MTSRRAFRASILAMAVGYLSILSPAVSAQVLYRRPTQIKVGDTWQTVVDAAPANQVFLVKAGTHRLQSVTPKNYQVFVGEDGAIMSGARVLSSWTFDGANVRWYAVGQTQAGTPAGMCFPGYPRCDYPEDLFVDGGDPLLHVAALADGTTGTWFFDYSADRIYVWDDPSGHTVETSVTTQAFLGGAVGVRIQNLTVEKYANPAQTGAIAGGVGWSLLSNTVRWNHGMGVAMAATRIVRGNHIHHNGQLGIGGTGNGSLVVDNEIAYNNTVGFDSYWEAGGSKFTFTDGLTLRGNYVHHNRGPGLWSDIDNIHIVYEYNRVEYNAQSGIFHEISEDAIIRFNLLRGNGAQPPIAFWGDGGILISTSRNVAVYGNTLINNWQNICGIDQDRGSGTYGTRSLENLSVHDNTTVSYTDLGSGTGLTGIFGNLEASTDKNNLFDYNTYYHNTRDDYFAYLESVRTASYWTGTAVFDTHGTVTVGDASTDFVNVASGSDVTGTLISGLDVDALNVASGNALVVFVRHDTGLLAHPTVRDTAGNTFTFRGEATLGPVDRLAVYEAPNVLGNSANVVHVDLDVPVAYVEVVVVQVAGVTVEPFDVLLSANGNGTALTSNTFTTTQAAEVILMAGSVEALGQTFTQGTGYTLAVTTPGGTMAVQYKVVATVQTGATAAMTVGGSAVNWEIVGVTLKQL